MKIALGVALGAAILVGAGRVHAQTGVKVQLKEVTDNRVAHKLLSSSLDLSATLEGKDLEKIVAARLLVDEAKDDRGTNLLTKRSADFQERAMNSGTLTLSLASPSRDASTVRVRGKAELFVPSRDPLSTVRVDRAFARRDVAWTSKKLSDLKLKITPLSAEAYVKAVKARKLTPEDIEELKKEGRAHGASEEEIEMAIGLAKAMEEGEGAPDPNSVVLSGSDADFDRIQSIRLLNAAGEEISLRGRQTSTRGDSSLMTLFPASPPPDDAVVELVVRTPKSVITVPYEFKSVTLP